MLIDSSLYQIGYQNYIFQVRNTVISSIKDIAPRAPHDGLDKQEAKASHPEQNINGSRSALVDSNPDGIVIIGSVLNVLVTPDEREPSRHFQSQAQG